MTPLFNENMTTSEARTVFFSSVDGKTKEEIELIKREYSEIFPRIMENELRRNEGYMTSDKL